VVVVVGAVIDGKVRELVKKSLDFSGLLGSVGISSGAREI
jgi:hypothetical protein